MPTAGGHYLIHCHASPSRRTGRRQTSIRLHRCPPRTLGASRKTSVAGKKQARDHRPITSGHRRDHGVDAGGEGTLKPPRAASVRYWMTSRVGFTVWR